MKKFDEWEIVRVEGEEEDEVMGRMLDEVMEMIKKFYKDLLDV